MNNILNLCRATISHLNEATRPPFKIMEGKNEGEIFITTTKGRRVARMWLNGHNDLQNAKMIVNSMNNCHRFAAALGIALNYLTHEAVCLPEIEKCFENENLNEELFSNNAEELKQENADGIGNA